ncbi:MAG: class I tRNA ligase family protein, partial [Minisyncoccales bacterium]
FGGQVEKDESSLEAIKRELKEELNLDVDETQIEFLCSVDSKREKTKHNNFFYIKNIDTKKLSLLEGEEIIVSGLDEIMENPDAGPFVEPVVKAFLEKDKKAYTGQGVLINSEDFNGLDNEEAKNKITEYLGKKGLAKKTVQYKFRDWLVSRQRYWGTPIPVVYCDNCGIVPVPENELPVVLPDKVDFGEGNPLSTNKDFVNTKCPKCGSDAKRETDTMDTFVDSSWYFLRYIDNNNSEKPFEKNKADYWMPVNQYIGGAEHACLHLIYARFWTKVLRDLGFVNINEPFKKLFNQGMLHASDGKKMSKSLGNVINPLDIIKTHGADSLRFTLMSFASPDSDTDWDEKVLEGSNKFLNKIYDKISKIKIIEKSSPRTESKLNKTIKQVTDDIDNFRNNHALIKIREIFNYLKEEESKEVIEACLKLLHPVCPHITEELWEKIGNKEFISIQEWPKADENKIDEKYEQQEQQVEKLINDINNIKKIIQEKQKKETKKGIIYVIPNEKTVYDESLQEIEKRTAIEIEILSVNEPEVKSGEKDPEEKSKKVKPGKPGIYLK